MPQTITASLNGHPVLELRIELKRGGAASTLQATMPPGVELPGALDVVVRDAETERRLRQFQVKRTETTGDGRTLVYAEDERANWQRPVHADINVPVGDGTAWRDGEPVSAQAALERFFVAAGLTPADAPTLPSGVNAPLNVRARGNLGTAVEVMLGSIGLTVSVDDAGEVIVRASDAAPDIDQSRVIESVTSRAEPPAGVGITGGVPLELVEIKDWICVLPNDTGAIRPIEDVLAEWGISESSARQACLSDGGFEQLVPQTGSRAGERLATLKRFAFRLFRAAEPGAPWLPVGGLNADGSFRAPLLSAKIARPLGTAPSHPRAKTIEETDADPIDAFELDAEARTVYLPRPPFALDTPGGMSDDATLQDRRLRGDARLSLTVAVTAKRPPFTLEVTTGGEGEPLAVSAPQLIAVYKDGVVRNGAALQSAADTIANSYTQRRLHRKQLMAGVDASIACGTCERVVIEGGRDGLTTRVHLTPPPVTVPRDAVGKRTAQGRPAQPLPSGLHQPINAFRAGPLVLRASGETPEGESILAIEAVHRRSDTGALELKHPGALAFPFFLESRDAAKFGRWFFVAGVEVAASGRLRVLGPDERHDEIPPQQLFEARHVAPHGLRGLIVSLGDDPVFVDSGPLISDARGREPGASSSLIYDVDWSSLSKRRRGGLHFLSVLVLSPAHKQENTRGGGWVPALNMRESDTGNPELAGRGLFAEGDGHALGRLTAKLQGGPVLADSNACTKHLYGMASDDGLYRESAGHISTDAFFKIPGDPVHDAPVKFYAENFEGSIPPWTPYEAQLKYDPTEQHPWNHKLREGRWKIQYRVPFEPTIPPTWKPPIGPPRDPVTGPPEVPPEYPSPLFLPYDIRPAVSRYNLWAPSHDWVPASSDRKQEREATYPGPSIKSEGWAGEASGEPDPSIGGGVMFMPPSVSMPDAQLDSGARQTFIALHPEVVLAFGHPAFDVGRVHSGWAIQLAGEGGHLELLPRDSEAATPPGLTRGVHVTGHMQLGPGGATFGNTQALRLGENDSEGIAFGDDIELYRDGDSTLHTSGDFSIGGGLAVETLSEITSANGSQRVLVIDDSGVVKAVKLEDLHPTGVNLISSIVSYTGSGNSGKTVTLTGINRAHCILLMRQGTGSPGNVSLYVPGGATGTITHNDLANGAGFNEDSLNAPAAGTAQTLTINTTHGSRNADGVSYRALVIGTPT
ncbi:MAG: hypothetical protein KDB68_09115 [Planctomycetes bacterium]|nr:hypothetical protein [Planctomycetota bacterium]